MQPWAFACVTGVALAACGGSSPDGLYLRLSAGSGSHITASSIEVIAADPAVLAEQRTSDQFGATGDAMIPYFVQRATTGEVDGAIDLAAGYTIVIEPDPALTALVPIAIARDSDDVITAIGAPTSADSPGATVPNDPSEAELIDVAMTPASQGLTAQNTGAKLAAGEYQPYACAGSDTNAAGTPSGYDWVDSAGREMRIILPAAGATDAEPRGLDLDCDGSPAPGDCDDLRSDIFPDAAFPACDGTDYACAGTAPALLVTGCGAACTNAGRELCDESNPPVADCTACASGASATCLASTRSADDNTRALCMPIIGAIPLPVACGATGCTLHVVDDSTVGIVGRLSLDGQTFMQDLPVGPNASGVLLEVTGAPESAPAAVGTVDIVVNPAMLGTLYRVTIDSVLTGSCPGGGSNTTSVTETMTCSPIATGL